MVVDEGTDMPEFRPINRKDWPRDYGDVPDRHVQQAIAAIMYRYPNLDEYQVADLLRRKHGYISHDIVAAVMELVLPGRR